jgi:hypothetical protein
MDVIVSYQAQTRHCPAIPAHSRWQERVLAEGACSAEAASDLTKRVSRDGNGHLFLDILREHRTHVLSPGGRATGSRSS